MPIPDLSGFDETLLEKALWQVEEQVSDVLLCGGAAHLDGNLGGLVIDRDEDECRRLIEEEAR